MAIPTGLAMAIPEGHVGLIWDKSGNAIKRGLKVLGGVVDAGYRGEIKVGIINHGTESHTFDVGDKVAQMLLQEVHHADFEEVESLDETARGEGGFGSTGK
jgi:dUTP pyrophosphatase